MPFDGSEYCPGSAPAEAVLPSAAGNTWLRALAERLRARPLWAFTPGEIRPEVTPAHLLRAARALIGQEDRWVQGRYETLRGRRCAMGALQAAARVLRHPGAFDQARDYLRTEALIRGYSHVEKMNDRSTHAEVLAAFDRAIHRAESGQCG
jgi:hypothetical protein